VPKSTSNISRFPSSYHEVEYDNSIFKITSVFTGEKELGPTLEKLAAQHVLREMDNRAKELLRA
jgi:hypothetical protein